MANVWGGKSSGWIRFKSSGWKRSGVENVQGGTCPRVEKVPEPISGDESHPVGGDFSAQSESV